MQLLNTVKSLRHERGPMEKGLPAQYHANNITCIPGLLFDRQLKLQSTAHPLSNWPLFPKCLSEKQRLGWRKRVG